MISNVDLAPNRMDLGCNGSIAFRECLTLQQM